MIKKLRAWHIPSESMREVESIDFKNLTVNLEGGEIDQYFDDVILMQATGFKDKNGKIYYDGDLVEWDDEIFQVKFDKYQFVLEGFYEPRQDVPYDFFSEQEYQKAEIIGNFYENTELLEGLKNENEI